MSLVHLDVCLSNLVNLAFHAASVLRPVSGKMDYLGVGVNHVLYRDYIENMDYVDTYHQPE